MRNFSAQVLRLGRTATRHCGSIRQPRDTRTLLRIALRHKATRATLVFSLDRDRGSPPFTARTKPMFGFRPIRVIIRHGLPPWLTLNAFTKRKWISPRCRFGCKLSCRFALFRSRQGKRSGQTARRDAKQSLSCMEGSQREKAAPTNQRQRATVYVNVDDIVPFEFWIARIHIFHLEATVRRISLYTDEPKASSSARATLSGGVR
jgi:hypothetical protein